MPPHRAPVQTPPSVPTGGALDRVAVPVGLARAALLNLVVAVALLAWLLPSPWGMLVPVAVLAQAAVWRHGASRALGALAIGGVTGAALGPMLGLGDWRRSAMALLLVLLSALLAWPPRAASAGR